MHRTRVLLMPISILVKVLPIQQIHCSPSVSEACTDSRLRLVQSRQIPTRVATYQLRFLFQFQSLHTNKLCWSMSLVRVTHRGSCASYISRHHMVCCCHGGSLLHAGCICVTTGRSNHACLHRARTGTSKRDAHRKHLRQKPFAGLTYPTIRFENLTSRLPNAPFREHGVEEGTGVHRSPAHVHTRASGMPHICTCTGPPCHFIITRCGTRNSQTAGSCIPAAGTSRTAPPRVASSGPHHGWCPLHACTHETARALPGQWPRRRTLLKMHSAPPPA